MLIRLPDQRELLLESDCQDTDLNSKINGANAGPDSKLNINKKIR